MLIKSQLKKVSYLFPILFLLACSTEYKDVGDISFDESIDDKNFSLCNENKIKQYYVRYSSDIPASYKGEKRAIENVFAEKYKFAISPEEDGYITLRFVVNCHGKPGRFRVEGMDLAFQAKSFDPKIVQRLISIAKGLTAWTPVKDKATSYDFYQYLLFLMEDGQIKKIMP